MKDESAKAMVGRNDPCPCGSGRKYKKCHAEQAAATATRAPLPRHATGPVVKTAEDIAGMRRAGRLAGRILHDVAGRVEPGLTTGQIDAWVHALTLEAGAYPSPLNYPHPPTDPRRPVIAPRAFPRSVCTSVNDV